MNEMKIILIGVGHEMHGDDEIGLESGGCPPLV